MSHSVSHGAILTRAGLRVHTVQVTPFLQNCSILTCTSTKKSAIIDPGGELLKVKTIIEGNEDIDPEVILLTHGHVDHAGGAKALAKALAIPVIGPHEEDRFLLDSMERQAAMFGSSDPDLAPCVPDRWLRHGDHLDVGSLRLDVVHLPGHTPGHVAFFLREQRLAFVGDVLFQGSVGRTDFPRGDAPTLLRSICRRLLPLGDDVSFISGHGEISTFGAERTGNPFLRGERVPPQDGSGVDAVLRDVGRM